MPTKDDLVAQVRARMRDELDDMCRTVASRIVDEVPVYRELPKDVLAASIRWNLSDGVELVGESGSEGEEELSRYAAVTAERALQGIPLDAVLRAFHLGLNEIWDRVRDDSVTLGLDLELALDVSDSIVRRFETITDAVARAHMEIGLQAAREDQQRRDAFLQGLLTGALRGEDLRQAAAGYGLDIAEEHVVARVEPTGETWQRGLTNRVQLALGGRAGVVGRLDDRVVALAPAAPDPIPDVLIAVSDPAPLRSAPAAFATAERVLDAARAWAVTGVVRLRDLSIRPAVLADRDLTQLFAGRLLTPVLEGGRSGEELLRTLRTWMELGMRYEETARTLNVHTNTVRHRVNRFEELTGTSLRDIRTVVELWWALEHHTASPGGPPPP